MYQQCLVKLNTLKSNTMNKEIQVGICFANKRPKISKKSKKTNPRKRSKFKARKSR